MSGPRILLASEMGGGNGHVRRLLPIAEALRTRGAIVICAMRDIVAARPMMAAGFDVLPAPRILEGLNLSLRAANYAELMIRGGLDRPERTLLVAAAWRDFLKMFTPDLVVADFAPGAMLGALVAGVPRASLGTGFALPPDVTPMPTFAPWIDAAPPRLHAAERAVLEAVNAALVQNKRPALTRLSELVNTGRDILCTFRELDHYDQRQGEPRYVGPIYSTPRGIAPPWPAQPGRKIFAYLAGDWPMFAAAIPALTNARESALLIFDSPTDSKWLTNNPHLVTSTTAVDLSQVLPHASVIISHGGMGLVSQALRAGVPMILFPRNPEQVGTARRVAALGCGLMLRGPQTQSQIEGAIQQVLSDPALSARAKQLSENFALHNPDAAAARIADYICEISMG